jgi:hypothetical protein
MARADPGARERRRIEKRTSLALAARGVSQRKIAALALKLRALLALQALFARQIDGRNRPETEPAVVLFSSIIFLGRDQKLEAA